MSEHIWEQFGFYSFDSFMSWVNSQSLSQLQQTYAEIILNNTPVGLPTTEVVNEILAVNSAEILDNGGRVIGTAAITGTSVAAGGTGLYSVVGGITSVALPVAAAACAAALGVGIGTVAGQYLYEANPDFWARISDAVLPACLKFEVEPMQQQVPVVVDDEGKSYFSEDFINLLKDALINNGVYNDGDFEPSTEIDTAQTYTFSSSDFASPLSVWNYIKNHLLSEDYNLYENEIYNIELLDSVINSFDFDSITQNPWIFVQYNRTSYRGNPSSTIYFTYYNDTTMTKDFTYGLVNQYAYYPPAVGERVNCWYSTDDGTYSGYSIRVVYSNGQSTILSQGSATFSYSPIVQGIAWLSTPDSSIISSNIIGISTLGTVGDYIEGINKESGATIPSLSDDISTTYPNWAADALNVSNAENDPTQEPTTTSKWYPVTLPTVDPNISNQTQGTATDGDVTTTPQEDALITPISYILKAITDAGIIPPSYPPTPDDGDTPTVVIPTLPSQLGMASVYNPTLAEIQSFNSFLWSTSFIDVIKKLMQNPMDAVISLHYLYATPSVGGRTNIICGYIDSGVESNYIDEQYINIDCGTVTVPNFYYNAIDYSPYTKLEIYLPFIGIQELNPDDCVGGTLNVKYHIDVFTGTCLAEIICERNNSVATLYTFSGNCSVEIPLTGSSFGGIVAGLLTASAAIAGTIATGGAAATAAVRGAGAMIAGAKTHISRSGSLGSNPGAMGIKTPYLILQRPISYDPVGFNVMYGYPANNIVELSTQSGFTRVKDVHVDDIDAATDDEKRMIETILKQGVII